MTRMQGESWKRCTKCGVNRPPAEYRLRYDGTDGLRGECLGCENRYRRLKYARSARGEARAAQRKQQKDALWARIRAAVLGP